LPIGMFLVPFFWVLNIMVWSMALKLCYFFFTLRTFNPGSNKNVFTKNYISICSILLM
jgi:hypothetical protein